MPEFENPHVQRLYESLRRHAGEEEAQRIVGQVSLSKTPNENQKNRWAHAVCALLRESFDNETVRRIRMDCACGPALGKMNALKKHYEKHGTLESIAEKLGGEGAPSWVEDGALYISYPQCYCSLVKHCGDLLPESWCWCSLGYTRRNLTYVLGRPVEVELLKSVKRGDERCLQRVTFP